MKKKNVWKQWITWFAFAIAVIVVYKILDSFGDVLKWFTNLLNVLMPFLMGILLAYLLYMPEKYIETKISKAKSKFIKKRVRAISVLIVYVLTLILIVLIIKFIVPSISESIKELLNNLPGYYNKAVENMEGLPEDSILKQIKITDAIKDLSKIDFQKFLNIDSISQYAKGVLNFAYGIFDLFVTIIISVYVLIERAEILAFVKKCCKVFFDDKKYNRIKKYLKTINEIFPKFVTSQLIDAIIVGIIISIAMLILRVKYAILLGFIVGLFNMIPYMGAIIAVTIAILITTFTGGIQQAILVAIVCIILQQIDANIINPKIVGDSLEISSILVIFSVTVGGAYFGILGMFLAVPIATFLKSIITDYIDEKVKDDEDDEEMDDVDLYRVKKRN